MAFERRISELSQKVADGEFYSASGVIDSIYSRDISEDDLDRMAERLARRDAVRAAYAADTGKDVKVEYKAQVYNAKFGNESLQKFIDAVGPQRIAEIEASFIEEKNISEALGSDAETIRDIMREYYANRDAALYDARAKRRNLTAEEKLAMIEDGVNKSMEKNVSDITVEDFARDAWIMYENGDADSDIVDRIATADNLHKVAPEKDVKQWLLGELDGVLGEPGIYNGAELFKWDGTSKSFKQTHWTYTLANIVKAMDKASARGQRAMATASGLQSVSAEEFGSIEAMREKRGRLGKVDDEASALPMRWLPCS